MSKCLLSRNYVILAVDCEHPGDIENGRVIVMNGTTYNSVVEYHCIPQFERVGPYLRKCLENGDWSSDIPRCEGTRNIFNPHFII